MSNSFCMLLSAASNARITALGAMLILASQLGVPFLGRISRPASTKRALLPTALAVCSMILFRI